MVGIRANRGLSAALRIQQNGYGSTLCLANKILEKISAKNFHDQVNSFAPRLGNLTISSNRPNSPVGDSEFLNDVFSKAIAQAHP